MKIYPIQRYIPNAVACVHNAVDLSNIAVHAWGSELYFNKVDGVLHEGENVINRGLYVIVDRNYIQSSVDQTQEGLLVLNFSSRMSQRRTYNVHQGKIYIALIGSKTDCMTLQATVYHALRTTCMNGLAMIVI